MKTEPIRLLVLTPAVFQVMGDICILVAACGERGGLPADQRKVVISHHAVIFCRSCSVVFPAEPYQDLVNLTSMHLYLLKSWPMYKCLLYKLLQYWTSSGLSFLLFQLVSVSAEVWKKDTGNF